MAATDVIEAEAEVARRDEAVIVADKNVANAEDRLRLLILNPQEAGYSVPLEPDEPADPGTGAVRADEVARALESRSDVRRLRSLIDTASLDVRQLKNDALPDVDVSASIVTQAIGGRELIRESGVGAPVIGSIDRGLGPVLGDLGQAAISGLVGGGVRGVSVGARVAKANAAGRRSKSGRASSRWPRSNSASQQRCAPHSARSKANESGYDPRPRRWRWRSAAWPRRKKVPRRLVIQLLRVPGSA